MSGKTARSTLIAARMGPGMNHRNRDFVVRLIQLGCSVEFVALEDSTNNASSPSDVRLHIVVCGLCLHQRHRFHLTGLVEWLRANWIALRSFFRVNPTLVMVCDLGFMPLLFVAKLTRKRLVYAPHEVWWGMSGYSAVLRGTMALCERSAILASDRVLMTSEERGMLVGERLRVSASHMLVYPNYPLPIANGSSSPADSLGVSLRCCTEGRDPDPLVLMFQGSLLENRGIETLCQLAESWSSVTVVIQGDGPLSEYVDRHVSRNMVRWPRCSPELTSAYLSAVDVSFVYYPAVDLNSRWAASSKFYASIFAGVPVLANRLDAFSAFSKRFGAVLFYEDLSVSGLQSVLQYLLRSKAPLEHLKAEARRAAVLLREDQRIKSTALNSALEELMSDLDA